MVYLLDTNHCSRIIRRDPGLLAHLQTLESAQLATCVTVRGELIFMAHKSQERHANLAAVHMLLERMGVYSVDEV